MGFSHLGSRRYGVARSWEQFGKACTVMPWGTGTNAKRPSPALAGDQPAQLERGLGSHVWDVDGNEYLDFRLALGPITLGYCDPRVDDAVREQMGRGVLTSLPIDLERRVAELLIKLVPGAQMVRFFKGGGEAMHAATRLARHVTGRDRVVTCGYHGWSLNMDTTQPEALRRLFTHLPYGQVAPYVDYLAAHGDETCCVCIGADYAALRSDDPFLAEVRELTRQHGVLLVVDEIITGFRVRCGGIHDYYGVTPDLAVFAKGMANGYPLAALVGSEEVMSQWPSITLTYAAEALSLAAGEAVLRIYRDEDVIGRLWQLGGRLQSGVNEAAARLGVPFSLEGLPPCSVMHFGGSASQSDPTRPASTRQDTAGTATELQRGLYRRGIIPLIPLYVCAAHVEEEIDYTVQAFEEALREAYGR